MIDLPYIADIVQPTSSKIVMLVVDGLGGLPHQQTGKSELESASIPNLDGLARRSACGLSTPVGPGVTPGSGPGHMALFGYDPVKYMMGRGVLEAIGIGVQLDEHDVAVRGNLATVDDEGLLVDRRAGRVRSSESAPIIEALDSIVVPGVEISVHPVRDYRFVLVMRGEELQPNVGETDPQTEGRAPLEAQALSPDAETTARAANSFVAAARERLKDRSTANMVILRGFSRTPDLPNMCDVYKLTPAAVAAYPMYRGIASLVGMNVLETGDSFDNELDTLENGFDGHDFFFLHYKPADAAGEDGDFEAKIAMLEALDERIPRLLNLGPDVLVVAGDHSTPAIMAGHSWHPVSLLVHSRITEGDGASSFSERSFAQGSIGRVPATSIMMTALAHAGKLRKFGP